MSTELSSTVIATSLKERYEKLVRSKQEMISLFENRDKGVEKT